jgi:hypothetical protein
MAVPPRHQAMRRKLRPLTRPRYKRHCHRAGRHASLDMAVDMRPRQAISGDMPAPEECSGPGFCLSYDTDCQIKCSLL